MALSVKESKFLAHCETVIEAGLAGFMEVGAALVKIRDGKLYRATHGSFGDYIREKWGMSARRAYQLCDASEVAENLKCEPGFTKITSEKQARPLVRLPKSTQRKAWKKAVVRADKEQREVSAQDVKEAVEELGPRLPRAAVELAPVVVVPMLNWQALHDGVWRKYWVSAVAEDAQAEKGAKVIMELVRDFLEGQGVVGSPAT